MTESCVLESPVGLLRVTETGGAISVLDWTDDPATPPTTPVLRDAAQQLADYFDGKLADFDLPLAPEGTAHQKKVWAALCAIPAGAVRSYGDLAKEIGSSARAVGTACGKNPIPIIVPCHRVLATGGGIGGYSGRGGVATKRILLNLEGAHLEGDLFSR
ncbi:MAG: methylated-DNA--[protein]-cysteine S-methyltransferase [Proteobacteria bacterium]|nr:methylated-DNA--[protein]-cysteine S-methyltransferase [Pseudomonadota bacterium]